MSYAVTAYNPDDLDRCMAPVPGGPAAFGLTADAKEQQARRAGVHPDMLQFHTDYREVEAGEFWIDRYPVTRGQFLRFLQATGYEIQYNGWLVGWRELTDWEDWSEEKHPLPMVGVNSEDAAAYAAWVGKRLPTEVEWEKAWRGSDGRLFPWGDDWQEAAVRRNPGTAPLAVEAPVGATPPVGPHSLHGYGQVLEWVQTVFVPHSQTGTPLRGAHYLLAGGSFRHRQEYSFLPSARTTWVPQTRAYNYGFRCVSATRPAGLVEDPPYRVLRCDPVRALAPRADLYRVEPIRLVPYPWATLAIHVPWFPESVWALDCPEADWDVFGGANAWPYRPQAEWRLPWAVEGDGQVARYQRRDGEKRVLFEAWVEGDTVHYRFDTEGLPPVPPGSFCFKTFSPFFSSQEREAQARLEGGTITRCCDLPLTPASASPFAWSLGEIEPPGRAALVSPDGTAQVLFQEGPYTASGNGWVPCTHLNQGGWGPGTREEDIATVKAGQGSFTFRVVQ